MSSDSSDGNGCGCLVLLVLLGWFVFSPTGDDIRLLTRGWLLNRDISEKAGDLWIENNPWPHSEEDAVRRCLVAIESRNWEVYEDCFEPSAILEQRVPGSPGRFVDVYISVQESDNFTGIAKVWIWAWWVASPIVGDTEDVGDLEIKLDEEIMVVRARKGFLGDIPLRLDFAMEGWFVAYSEWEKLPFNFDSKLPSEATPFPEETAVPIP